MIDRPTIRNGQCGPRYLQIPGVLINAQLGPTTVEVFLELPTYLLVKSGIVDLQAVADEYRERIQMGVWSTFRIIDA